MPTVLVTGATRGIGRTTAIRLATNGWDVFAGVRRAQDGEELRGVAPARISPVILDITDADQVASLEEALAHRRAASQLGETAALAGEREAAAAAA